MNLPEYEVPMENQAPIEFKKHTIDGEPSTAIEIAIQEPGEARPLSAWVAFPGPNTPQVRGSYFVMARATGSPKPAVCVGKLVVK